MPLGGYTVFIWSSSLIWEVVFNHNEIMIYWCCNYFCKLYCVWTFLGFFCCFFFTFRGDKWVSLFYSLLFHWYLLNRCNQCFTVRQLICQINQQTQCTKTFIVTLCRYLIVNKQRVAVFVSSTAAAGCTYRTSK